MAKRLIGFLSFFSCVLISLAAPVLAEPLVISGSSTVTNFVFRDHGADYTAETGLDFELIPSSSGRGVLALAQGEADIAMISSELGPLLDKLKAGQASDLNRDDFELHPISETRVLFIVHPDNPIRALDKQQVKALFTGEIRDWADLGHPELGLVKVVSEHPTGGIYNLVLSAVTDKEPLVANKIIMQNAPQVALVVSQLPNGFGMLSDATPADQRKGVVAIDPSDFEAVQHLAFVTRKGKTSPEASAFIDFIQGKFAP